MPEKLQYPTCRQLLDDSRYCPNPALHSKSFCRHHSHERQRLRNLAKARQLKEYTQPKRSAADPNFRPDEELNGAIFDSMRLPTLDTFAAITVAASNVVRLLGAGHLSARAAHVMASLIRISEINLRQNQPFAGAYRNPVAAVDHDPVPPLGDDEGFVLPEETNVKRVHNEAKAELGADVLNETRASMGLMPTIVDECDPKYAHLPPAERGRAAYRDLRAAINGSRKPSSSVLSASPVVEGVSTGDGKPETGNRERSSTGASAPAAGKGTTSVVPAQTPTQSALAAEVSAQAGEPVPQNLEDVSSVPALKGRDFSRAVQDSTKEMGALAPGISEGHGFSHANNDWREAPTALPKASVQRETRNARSLAPEARRSG